MSGGECKVFQPAPHVILGKTSSDQDWIDNEVESGVAACGFPRPRPRPAALDAPPATRQVPSSAPIAAAPVKKKGLLRRFRERVLTPPPAAVAASPAPVPYIPAPQPEPAPAAVPERPRRDPVLEFLRPNG